MLERAARSLFIYDLLCSFYSLFEDIQNSLQGSPHRPGSVNSNDIMNSLVLDLNMIEFGHSINELIAIHTQSRNYIEGGFMQGISKCY